MQTGVYTITNKITNQIYVGSTGKSFKERWWKHKNQFKLGNHYNPYLRYAVAFYGIDNFEFEVLEECEPSHCVFMEQYWMNLLCSYDLNFGYNFKTNVTSNLGAKHSEETKRKISLGNKGKISPMRGKKLSEETKAKMSKSQSGRKMKEEFCIKNGLRKKGNKYWLGKKHSEATKKRLSQYRTGKQSPMKGVKFSEERINQMITNPIRKKTILQFNKEGVFIKEWPSIRGAARILNLQHSNIASCAKGIAKSCGGFIWKFYS